MTVPSRHPAPKRILVIHNPAAGWRRRGRLARVLNALSRVGVVVTVRATATRGDAEAFAREATAREFDAIAVAGGDGTINDVINGLADDSLALAIIPLGTANVVAAEVGSPTDADAIARMLAAGNRRTAYLGVANGRKFAMMASVGFDAHVVARVGPRAKRLLGRLAYVVEGVRGLFRFPVQAYRVVIDGAPYEAASIVIANGRYYGGRHVLAPAARLEDSSFHVCLFEAPGRWAALRYAAALVQGRIHRLSDLRIITGTRVRIEGPDGEPFQADGDIAGRLPLAAHAGAAKIDVIVPS